MEVILSRSIIYTSIVMLVSIAGCGSKQEAPDGGTPGTGFGLGGEDFDYQWDDPRCLEGSLLATATSSATTSSWAERTRRDVSSNLENMIDQSGHFSSAVFPSRVVARMQFTRDCDHVSNQTCLTSRNTEAMFTSDGAGQNPRFCRASGNYSIDSIERVALTSALSFKHAQEFAAGAYKENGAIAPVQLLILPRFASKIPSTRGNSNVTDTKVLTNNLAYFPVKNGMPYIAVFPRDKNATEDTARLWESSFVLAHEYGHHIERYLRVDRFDDISVSPVRRAVSEAFADINAHATGNLNDSSVLNIPCFGSDRAVGVGNFKDSVAKVFDKLEIQNVENRYKTEPTSMISFEFESAAVCAQIDKAAYHAIGAIFAYNVNAMIGLALDAVRVPATDKAKKVAGYTADWIRETDRLINKGSKSPRGDIIGGARALETTVKAIFNASNVPLTTNIADALCQRMNLGFSGTGEKTWFGRDCVQTSN